MGVLGHKVFESLTKTIYKEVCKSVIESQILFSSPGKYKAYAIFTTEGFVLLKGSEINPTLYKSAGGSTVKARQKYQIKINNNITKEDILFTSPSAAATFVSGFSTNGNLFWRTKDGKCPKDFNL